MIYAFRYALGRKTYAVRDVCDCLISNWDELGLISKKLIHKEIIEFRERYVKIGLGQNDNAWDEILNLKV